MKNQLLVRAHVIRAAGGAGDRERFRKTWNEAIKLTREQDAVPVPIRLRDCDGPGELDFEKLARRRFAEEADPGVLADMTTGVRTKEPNIFEQVLGKSGTGGTFNNPLVKIAVAGLTAFAAQKLMGARR